MVIRKRLFAAGLAFFVAATAVSTTYALLEHRENARQTLKDEGELKNQIAIAAVSVEGIREDAEKLCWCSSSARCAELSAELRGYAGSAAAAISALPTYGLRLDKTHEFLDRVADYALYLTKLSIAGEEPGEEDRQNLLTLSDSAAALSGQLAEIEEAAVKGNLCGTELTGLFALPEGDEAVMATDGEGETSSPFAALEALFSDEPFNYDGQYSDHLKLSRSAALSSLDGVTEEEAKAVAASLCGGKAEDLTLLGEGGRGECGYRLFSDEESGVTLSLSKLGGKLLSFSDRGKELSGEENLTEDEAEEKALALLSEWGLPGMEAVSRIKEDGLLTFTFVPLRDGVRFYPEEVTLTLSLDDGRAITFDATDYYTKGQTDALPTPVLTEEEALAAVSPRLTVEKILPAVISSAGGREIFCWECECEAENGCRLRLFLNGDTGEEEDIRLTDSLS